jgi:hypothetical protein
MKDKCLILFLILFGLSIILPAQVRYIRNFPIQLPLTYLFDPQYTPKQIFPTPEGGVIILGDCLAHYGEYPDLGIAGDCGAIKLDDYGNCEWQWWSRDFHGWGGPRIIGIDQEADGRVNFLINVGSDYNKLGWINPNGTNNLEYIQLPHIGISRAKRLLNGDIFVIGSSTSQSLPYPNNICATFLRLNPQGDSLSMHLYAVDSLWIQPGLRIAVAYDMELDSDGMPVSTSQFTDRFASVVKTDWNGNLIWRRDTANPLCRNQSYPITKIPVTNEIVFGYQAYNNNYRNQFSIYRISGTGLDSLYSIQMSDTVCVGSYYSIVGHSQGIYLYGFYGDYSIDVFNEEVHISDYTFQGQQIWDWSIPSPFNLYQPTDCITVLPDSSVVHVFGNDDFGDYGLTIVKLSPSGTEVEDEAVPKPELQLCTYPNPMVSSINIDFKSRDIISEEFLSADIFNIKGQIVKSIMLNRKSTHQYSVVWDGFSTNGKACAPGAYIIKVNASGKSIIKKIILLRQGE